MTIHWLSFLVGILASFGVSTVAVFAMLAFADRSARRYQAQVRGGYSRTIGGGWPR